MAYDFLNDRDFLYKLTDIKSKELYTKIYLLSWNEDVIREIQGEIMSGGSLNIDGTSSLRRTGSLNIFLDNKYNNLENIESDISINKKIKLEIGVKNTVQPESFIESRFKDGTERYYNVDFQELYGDIVWFPLGTYVIFNPSVSHSETGVSFSFSIKDKMCLLNGDAGGVIPAAVTFSELEYEDEDGNVQIENPTLYQIIIELVNHFGKENLAKIIISDLDTKVKRVMKYTGSSDIYYVAESTTAKKFFTNTTSANAAKPSYGNIVTYGYNSDIGYILTDFTYPGDLTCNPGETVTSVLDKIVTLLGNYEYFYDVYGNFHFQEIKNYLNTTYTTTILREASKSPDYQVDFSRGTAAYIFRGLHHISSISSSYIYNNVKNDFVVWGTRKTTLGDEIPIRYHVAIDRRPPVIGSVPSSYGKHVGKDYYGIHKNIEIYLDNEDNRYKARKVTTGGVTVYTIDYREELYYQGIEAVKTGTDSNYYFTELYSEWPVQFNLKEQAFYEEYIDDPSLLNFFLDIIDDSSPIGKYSVNNIGRRSIVVQESEINCIFEKEIPDLVFLNEDELSADELNKERDRLNDMGQRFYQIDNLFANLLAKGGVLNSAYYRITELLYQNTNMSNGISFTTLPLYFLEPNTRISVQDEEIGVNDDYVITTISLPLGVEGTMSVSGYKCLQRI